MVVCLLFSNGSSVNIPRVFYLFFLKGFFLSLISKPYVASTGLYVIVLFFFCHALVYRSCLYVIGTVPSLFRIRSENDVLWHKTETSPCQRVPVSSLPESHIFSFQLTLEPTGWTRRQEPTKDSEVPRRLFMSITKPIVLQAPHSYWSTRTCITTKSITKWAIR